VNVVIDKKIQTALRTNQIASFVTVLSWEKIQTDYFSTFKYENRSKRFGLYSLTLSETSLAPGSVCCLSLKPPDLQAFKVLVNHFGQSEQSRIEKASI